MRRLQDHEETEQPRTDNIDKLINVCRIGAFVFACIAVYLISIKQQPVLWPAIVSILLLIAGVVLGNMPRKVETSEGKKDRKSW